MTTTRKGRVWKAVKTLVSLGLIAAILVAIVRREGMDELLARARRLDPWLLLAAVLAQLGAVGLGIRRWQGLLRSQGIDLPYRWLAQSYLYADLDLTVVETMVGVDSAGCFSSVPVGGHSETGPGETADFAVLRDEATGETWRIGSMVEGAFDALRAGDTVHLTTHFAAGGFGSGGSDLLLVRADGSLVHGCGDSTGVCGLRPPPDFSIHTGDTQCRGKDSCGRWTEYGLVFAIGGKSVSANYDHVAIVDGYRVLTGGVTEGGRVKRSCSDGGGDSAYAAITAIDPVTP